MLVFTTASGGDEVELSWTAYFRGLMLGWPEVLPASLPEQSDHCLPLILGSECKYMGSVGSHIMVLNVKTAPCAMLVRSIAVTKEKHIYAPDIPNQYVYN